MVLLWHNVGYTSKYCKLMAGHMIIFSHHTWFLCNVDYKRSATNWNTHFTFIATMQVDDQSVLFYIIRIWLRHITQVTTAYFYLYLYTFCISTVAWTAIVCIVCFKIRTEAEASWKNTISELLGWLLKIYLSRMNWLMFALSSMNAVECQCFNVWNMKNYIKME